MPNSLKYETDILLDEVSFEPDVYLVSKSICIKLTAEVPSEVPEPPEDIIPGAGAGTGGEVPVEPVSPGEQPEVETYQHLRLVVEGIPASKIADVNRGILLPLNRAVGDFNFTLEIDVTSQDGISKTTL